MHYKFPEIRHLDDVLPYIQTRGEFILAEREGYKVVNYVVAMADTFDMTGPDDLGGAIRRECRGLIFDREGYIISRPFHKFFNINEREETQSHVVDMSQDHIIMEKMDGSMIRPIVVDGYLRLATKMGVTEVAMQAETWLAAQDPAKKEWMRDAFDRNETPIFEWISPFNQIVLAYEEADLVYLGSRNNFTGEYMFDEAAPFTKVPRYGSVEGNISDYIARQRQAEGREGDIIRFADGHMLKVKNDWYVRIHKTVDRIVFERNIVNLIINEEIDDVMPMLPVVQANRVRNFEIRFWKAFKQTENRLYGLRMACDQSYEGDRKAIATQFVPTVEDKQMVPLLFRVLDGNDVRDVLMQHVEKQLFTNVKWDACAKWMGM
jgi:RNA ligase